MEDQKGGSRARMGVKKNGYRFLVGKYEGKNN
jgi:hypothetical protein